MINVFVLFNYLVDEMYLVFFKKGVKDCIYILMLWCVCDNLRVREV